MGKKFLPLVITYCIAFVSLSSPLLTHSQNEEEGTLQEAGETSFSFAVIGDTQKFESTNVYSLPKAVRSISKKNPDFTLAMGDLVGSCSGGVKCTKAFQRWKKIVSGELSDVYEVMGNHDRTNHKAESSWQKVFKLPTNGPSGYSELTYSFDYDNSHFVVLNSEKPRVHAIDSDQRQWLEQDLSNTTKENVFVFFHEPAWPVSSKINESLDVYPSERDALWSILDKYKVKAVFSAHEHIFSRKKINSSVFSGAQNEIYQFVVGNTAAYNHAKPRRKVSYSHVGEHYAIVTVSGSAVKVNLYSVGGKLLNSFKF